MTSQCWQARVTYVVRGWPVAPVTVTTNAPSRLEAGQAVNRYMTGLRSECYEVSREIVPAPAVTTKER
jgi:hypothetical protein